MGARLVQRVETDAAECKCADDATWEAIFDSLLAVELDRGLGLRFGDFGRG